MYIGEGYYMLVTTLSTVGYGDLEPVSNFGRGYISVVMLFTFVYLLPSQTRQMIEILSTMSPYLAVLKHRPAWFSISPCSTVLIHCGALPWHCTMGGAVVA